jgi:transcriptional regulator GlxA family with amidase domain
MNRSLSGSSRERGLAAEAALAPGQPTALRSRSTTAARQEKPSSPPRAKHMGFLLLKDYSMIALSSAVEPLRMANLLSGEERYRWTLFTLDGAPVAASNGMIVTPESALAGSHADLDALFVCGGICVEKAWQDVLREPLHRLARRRIPLGALCTGTYVLARAGLLDGYRCTIHWENATSLRELFPSARVSQELFEIDRDRYTCSGGTAPLDMMLNLIAREHGRDLAVAISEEFLCERIRGPSERQRVPLRERLGRMQPILSETVALMEANVEEPLSIDELAVHLGISRRQLERLFRKYLNTVPTRYYLELRLRQARQLLLQTNMSVGNIAIACGFASTQHFSTCYREFFGMSPRTQRVQVWPLPRTPSIPATAPANEA